MDNINSKIISVVSWRGGRKKVYYTYHHWPCVFLERNLNKTDDDLNFLEKKVILDIIVIIYYGAS